MNHRLLFFLCCLVFSFACNAPAPPKDNFNNLAERYVKLGLAIGQYDSDFVDAYYGPDSLRPKSPKLDSFPRDSFLHSVTALESELSKYRDSTYSNDTIKQRAIWISKQLTAFSRRIKMFSGELKTFDEEVTELFDVKVPVYNEDHFKSLVAELDKSLPGKGSISERVDQLASHFIIPKAKVDTVFKEAIEEARKRTHAHYNLPSDESFTLEYVNDKPWSGYNWYKGNFHSLIQINLDLPIYIDRAIDLACHEGYPGHHVYNMMLEKNLYRDKGWVEISLYPLFSPQSLIAEGSANYGIDLAFPGTEKNIFTKAKLLPLAGLDSANLDLYYKVIAIKAQLNYARNEVARRLLNGSISDSAATKWLTQYALMSAPSASKSINFIRKYRTYVICYNYGQDLVKNFVEHNGGLVTAPAKRWEVFGWVLSNPVTPTDLIQTKPIP